MGLFGIKVPKLCSDEKANELCKKAWELYDTGKYEKAVDIFAQLAEQDFAKAQNAMGSCCKEGRGLPQNTAMAIEWFTKAAKQEYGAAYYNLGKLYEDGKLVSRDEQKIFYYYSEGAARKYPSAQYRVGCCYANGIGVIKNELMALSFWISASLAGNKDADLMLKKAVLDEAYEKHVKDYLIPYYEQRPENDTIVYMLLGYCYEHGIGVTENAITAHTIYLKAILDLDRLSAEEKALAKTVKLRSQIIK